MASIAPDTPAASGSGAPDINQAAADDNQAKTGTWETLYTASKIGKSYRIDFSFAQNMCDGVVKASCLKIVRYSEPTGVKVGDLRQQYQWMNVLTLNGAEIKWLLESMETGTLPASMSIKDPNGFEYRSISAEWKESRIGTTYLSITGNRNNKKPATMIVFAEAKDALMTALRQVSIKITEPQ